MNKWIQRKKLGLGYWLRRHLFTPKNSHVRVLIITVPKSGTHLITRCLDNFPGLLFDGRHLRDRWGLNRIKNVLETVRPGYFLSSHLRYSSDRLNLIKKMGFRIILLLRDPRDQAISHVHFVTYKRKNSRLYKLFSSLPDDAARLNVEINGVNSPYAQIQGDWYDIQTRLHKYGEWMTHDCCVVYFEQLIGPQGGGEKQTQVRTIEKIGSYLGVTLTETEINHIASQMYSKRSATYRKGIIGDWKNHFSDEHKKMFKNVAGELLIDWGYESDMNW